MGTITYVPLTRENCTVSALDTFELYQVVQKCWRRINGALVLIDHPYIEDWTLKERRAVARQILAAIDGGAAAQGAFLNNTLIGFAFLDAALFGKTARYLDLVMLYVSRPFRNHGIGKTLFRRICAAAKGCGAEKLYISANSSMETQAFYRGVGCVEATELNQALANQEPCDIQMEYIL